MVKNDWTKRLKELQKENAGLKETIRGKQIKKGSEEIILNATSLIGSTNNLIVEVIDENRKNIIFWKESINTWVELLNKKVNRYLKKTEKEEEKVPF